MTKKDGMERLTKPFLFLIVVLLILAAIGEGIMAHNGDRLFKFFRTESLGHNILVGVVWGYVAVFLFFTGAFFVILAVNYCNSMRNFLAKIRFDPEKSELEQRLDHLLFRAHQVLHVQAMEFTSTLIALVLGMSCQIAGICTMIYVVSVVPLALVVQTATNPAVVTGATKACLDFAMKYTKGSQVLPASFRECSKNISYAAVASPQQLRLH